MVENTKKVVMIPHDHEYINKLKDSLEENAVEVSSLKPFHYSTLFNFLKVFWLKFKGFKIIHVHWLYVFPFVWLMKLFVLFGKKLGYRFVWTIHNVLPHEVESKDIEKTRWFFKNMDHCFIHYKSNVKNLEEVLGFKPENVKVIYHPTFEGSYPNNIGKNEARQKLGVPLDKKMVLCFGMFRKYKGMELFADVFESLDEDFYGVIAGEGKDKNVLRYLKNKEEKVDNLKVFDGFVKDENIQVFFNACDVVVLPYLNVTTSGVVLLAYSFSRPVITTNVGGLKEVVEDGETGFLIPPDDVESLEKAVKKIFSLGHMEMGEKAYQLSKEKFSWDKVAKATDEIYKKVISL
ncbi:MAG: glycosyltransferase family 4 protein [Candidatus Thermoplasmatota archaeon]